MKKLFKENIDVLYKAHENTIKKEIEMLKQHSTANHEADRKPLRHRNSCSDATDHTLRHRIQNT